MLYDTCRNESTILQNAKIAIRNGVKIERVVLSQWHSDHKGGLLALRKRLQIQNPKAFSIVCGAKRFFN